MVKNYDNPSATYRGYRRQALYNLHRILVRDRGMNLRYRPEGMEDLEIRDQDKLIEVVQVKDLSNPLSLSDLEPDNNRKFFGRLPEYLQENREVRIVLACFGEVGPELKNALKTAGPDRIKVVDKIVEKNTSITKSAAQEYLEAIHFEKVNEAVLERDLQTVLSKIGPTAWEPHSALKMLRHFIYMASENTEFLSPSQTMDEVNKIGTYLYQRSTFHEAWSENILPLATDFNLDSEKENELRKQFDAGQAARYEHILADLDVKRPRLMGRIRNHFKDERVVIVHGVSGQGKTTLAFRYLHEYFADQQVFCLRNLAGRRQAENLAGAVEGILSAKIPIMLYLDVHPGDHAWWEFLERLSPGSFPHLQILITIREEDFRRTIINENAFSFAKLEVELDKAEAAEIFENLPQRSPDFLDFNSAWGVFGGNGPLMELIYLVTKGQSLERQLKQQIQCLESELSGNSLDFLRLFAVATAYEARLDVKVLLLHLNLSPSQFKSTLRRLEKEFLLRIEGGVLLPVHPIRSKIMSDLLGDPDLLPWSKDALTCLRLIHEEDLDFFLHMAFVERPIFHQDLRVGLVDFEPKTWLGRAGVCQALVWLGVHDYTKRNRPLLDKAAESLQNMAGLLLDWNLIDVTGCICGNSSSTNLWNLLGPEAKAMIDELNRELTPKEEAFRYARDWLGLATLQPAVPQDERDWNAICGVANWISVLKITDPWEAWLGIDMWDRFLDEADVESLGDLIAAQDMSERPDFQTWYSTQRIEIEAVFLQKTNCLFLETDETHIKAHFPMSLRDIFDSLNPENPNPNIFHQRKVRMLSLMRKFFPRYQTYGCQGYGHRKIIQNANDEEATGLTGHDDSYKSEVPKNMLVLEWIANLNGLALESAGRKYRPKNWREYTDDYLALREQTSDTLEKLVRFFNKSFRRKQITIPSDLDREHTQLRNALNQTRQLPQSILDPWGYVSDGTSNTQTPEEQSGPTGSQSTKALGLDEAKALQNEMNRYTSSLRNFLDQSVGALMVIQVARDPRNKAEKEAWLEKEGFTFEMANMSLYNLQTACRHYHQMKLRFEDLLYRFTDTLELANLCKREINALENLMAIWTRFLKHPRLELPEGLKQSIRLVDKLNQRIEKAIKASMEQLDGRPIVTISRHDAAFKKWFVVKVDFQDDPIYALDPSVASVALASVLSDQRQDEMYEVAMASFSQIALVPTWRGKMLENQATIIEIDGFNTQLGVQAKYCCYPSLPQTLQDELQLKQLEVNEDLRGFQEAMRRLLLIQQYIADFLTLIDNELWDNEDQDLFFAKALEDFHNEKKHTKDAVNTLVKIEGLINNPEINELLNHLKLFMSDDCEEEEPDQKEAFNKEKPSQEMFQEEDLDDDAFDEDLEAEVPYEFMGIVKAIYLTALEHLIPSDDFNSN